MQLHTLLGMEAVDMNMHCIALFEVYLYLKGSRCPRRG
jgi:hypothetical protein